MTDLYNQLQDYAMALSTAPPDYLHRLERETHLTTLAPQMLSGPLQGRFLALLSHLLQPKLILEIGAFTGYGALCLAEGLAQGGKVHTLEAQAERAQIIRKYIGEAGFEDRIELHIGDALTLIPTIPGTFDLVFIDAGKQDYGQYFNLVIDRVRAGGLIIADNVLWSGKVLQPGKDLDAQALHDFNQMVQNDPRVESLLLPLRDGLLIVRRL